MSSYLINPEKIDWSLSNSAVFFNEKSMERERFLSCIKHLPFLKSHVWITTSGRIEQKYVALSKKAFLVSASAVNQHLNCDQTDRWGVSLPFFHVGGLSILARVHLAGCSCFHFSKKWSASAFLRFLNEYQITLSSLVPAQVYDLVRARFSCPPSLRAIVVGGTFLSEDLYLSARELKWPLLPSYGLTECASQVATAERKSLREKKIPDLKILSHIRLRTQEGRIAIQSQSLLTGFVSLSDSKCYHPRKQMDWYITADKGRLKNGFLENSISSASIKILGEKVSLRKREMQLMKILLQHPVKGRYFLVPLPYQREGFRLALVSDVFEPKILRSIIKQFNEVVSAFERIREFYFLRSLPLTSLFKISREALLKTLAFSQEDTCLPPPDNHIKSFTTLDKK